MSGLLPRLIAALDLGSTRVVAGIGEVTGDPRAPGVRVLGVGHERTTGIRRGVVRDIEETTRAITKALKDAQKEDGEGDWDECVDAVKAGTRALGR